MEGAALIEALAKLSGLPNKTVIEEIVNLLDKNGLNPATVTLEQIRPIFAQFARDIIKDQLSQASYSVEAF